MPRYAICNETWGDLPLRETCARVARAGYDGIELAPFTLARQWNKPADTLTVQERQAIRQTVEEAGLVCAGLHWLLVPPPDDLHLTTSESAVRQRTAVYLEELAHLCADLGGAILVLGSPKQRSVADGESAEAARAHFLETIAPCLVACETRGVTLCLEPLGPVETNFLNTLTEARSLIQSANSPKCRTIFDVKAASTESVSLTQLIRENADIISHVHANDANRRGPGFGETDFVPIRAALNEIGYEGWISVEVFDYLPDPDTIATKSLETLRAAQTKAITL